MKTAIIAIIIGAAAITLLHLTGNADTEIRIGVVNPKSESRFITSDHDGHKFIHSRYSTQFFIHHPDCACRKEVK